MYLIFYFWGRAHAPGERRNPGRSKNVETLRAVLRIRLDHGWAHGTKKRAASGEATLHMPTLLQYSRPVLTPARMRLHTHYCPDTTDQMPAASPGNKSPSPWRYG